MRSFAFDLYDALRGLRRDRIFAALVVVTLALTIGATTAVFSIVNGVLLRPLAYDDPERLVTFHESWREFAHRVPTLPVNERHFEYWRGNARSFEAMAQYLPLPANLTTASDAVQVSVARTTTSLFDVLRVRPILGRAFVAADEDDTIAVISHRLWMTHLGGRPSIVGTSLSLDGHPFIVVGVLPASFRLPMGQQLIASVDAFVPLRVDVGWVGDHNDVAIGRLRADVSLDEAHAELDVLQAQVTEIATKEAGEPVTLTGVVTPLSEFIVGRARRGLLLLFGAILAVLLIACANLANLSLARALAQARNGAIRSALGASRLRLVRRVMLEQMLLAVVAAMLGVWVAYAGVMLFVRTAPVDLPRLDEVAIDVPIVAFAFVLASIAGLLVSVLPAWHLAGRDVQALLRAGGSVIGADRAGLRARAALLSLQLAVSVTLLAVTGLLGLSLLRVLDIDRGFSDNQVIAVPVALPLNRYADDRARVDVYDRMFTDVRRVAGVTSVSPTSLLPMRGEGQVNLIVADGTRVPRSEQPSANFRFVAPDYFATLQLPLKAGRTFADGERDHARPAPSVISESVANRLWPGQDPLGKVFSRGIEGEQPFAVVGVAIDARTTSLEQPPPLMVYVPYWWRTRAATTILVRSAMNPTAIVPDIRRAIRGIDPEIAIGDVRLLTDVVAAATATRRYQSRLFIVFAGVALLIATLGVYAVTAYSLSRRRREMNIRVALGARTAAVVGLIVRQTGRAVILGIALGVAGALLVGRTVASLLYEVQPHDAGILLTVAGGVALVAIAATLLATRKELSLNPVDALRQE